ncbi:MAG TPA: hypothetical protein VK961_14805 [Chthoniobacter sp.]|nr:hypothetical protein [Chthoniobacter sp.]
MTALRTLLIFIVATPFMAPAEPPSAVFPYEPAQLLAALPAAPAEWSTTRSEAETTLGDWLETRATRVYRRNPSTPAENDAVAASAPLEVEISVTDTGGLSSSLAAFANFTPGQSGRVEKKLIGSLPSIIFAGEDGRQLTQVLVSGRYIIELAASRSSQFRVDDWLRAFRFNDLPPVSATPHSRPKEFRLTHVDELHPENNRSYSVSTTNSSRVSSFLKSLPVSSGD